MVTDATSLMWSDEHILHTFLPSTSRNNGGERQPSNLVRMRDIFQSQCVSSGFTLRTLALLPYQPSQNFSITTRLLI